MQPITIEVSADRRKFLTAEDLQRMLQNETVKLTLTAYTISALVASEHEAYDWLLDKYMDADHAGDEYLVVLTESHPRREFHPVHMDEIQRIEVL